MKRKALIAAALVVFAAVFAASAFYSTRHNIILPQSFSNADFGIADVQSATDADGDGADDQSDILQSARAYVETKPKYKSRYYEGGYPNDGCGVCTDVVAQAMLGAGYDLRELVNLDIMDNPNDYNIDNPDKNIDFRRVKNLRVYFENHARSLTTDVDDTEQWQGGDVVVFENHIGVVSDKRNKNGVAFIIHHSDPFQLYYEEDAVSKWGKIAGHYRIT